MTDMINAKPDANADADKERKTPDVHFIRTDPDLNSPCPHCGGLLQIILLPSG